MPLLRKRAAVLVTGTPGTGKTTISRLLATAIQARYVNPARILTRKGIDYTYDKDRRTRAVSVKRLQRLLSALSKRADCGLVIDSHIAFEIPPPLKLERAIVLRCSPAILEERLRRKHWSKDKISENLLAEILDICLYEAVQIYGWRRISEIDTTCKRPNCAAQLAIRALENKEERRQSKVDWLGTLKRDGKLAHYLA